MATIQHVYKRGSVYWWRRRLPLGTGVHAWVRLEISLHTKELGRARVVAPEVTLASHRLLPSLRHNMISPEDAKKILIQAAKQHSFHLDAMMAIGSGAGVDAANKRQTEIRTGWAFRLFAAQGINARVGPDEEREMRAAGLDDEMVQGVCETIAFLSTNGFGQIGRRQLEAILKEHNIAPAEAHILQAEQLCLRGMSAALLNTERRWSGVRPDDIALLNAALIGDMAAAAASHAAPTPAMSQQTSVAPLANRTALSFSQPVAPPAKVVTPVSAIAVAASPAETEDEIDLDDEDEAELELQESDRGLVEIVRQAAEEKVAIGEWRSDMIKQQVSVARLFVRFVGHDQPARMQQTNISEFRSMLFKLPKNHGRSPKDHIIPLSELLARAKGLPPEEVGLSPGTINRYMTQISNIVDICKHAGYPFGNFEGVSGLRAKRRGDVRNERGRFSTEEIRTIFSLPVWEGAASFDERFASGEEVFHDAAYWVPLLAIYIGARREEMCGLLLSEVETDQGLPCIRIEKNSMRKLKNEQSKRRVPVHPELIRLGFLRYVEELRTLGHELLFPELKAACATTPMGDVFDDSWQKIRAAALPRAKEEGKVLHSLRHWCNDEMKQAGTQAEIRKDILGHSNEGVNEGRYTNPARLRVMADALSTLPLPTAHLKARPIHLTESVLTHASRPARARKSAT
ncbi:MULTISPECIES: site-specific integrase [Rhizobium/Agrobacterium group]|uniref:Phage integrase family protein n=1 Tax=Agrobacterium tomkonis CFBP 6623 TaxID=1183432 RepID=A0A1S7Q068_9HYPH|nr:MULTISPECIES: site-specific integrase [Rhizobium/Agrobacterium group]QCL88102.1 site-specific integrase [Agrobacterium tumefaciens]CUX29335.1 Phage integrase family protein [Agrobacterium tomkonis CFBP 6623]